MSFLGSLLARLDSKATSKLQDRPECAFERFWELSRMRVSTASSWKV